MPIYEYKCRGCGKEFELLILPKSTGTPECPSCHSQALDQLLSAFGFSSEERSQSVVNAAQKAYERGELRDKRIADEEIMRHHDD